MSLSEASEKGEAIVPWAVDPARIRVADAIRSTWLNS